jgi:hypothetical protein
MFDTLYPPYPDHQARFTRAEVEIDGEFLALNYIIAPQRGVSRPLMAGPSVGSTGKPGRCCKGFVT